MRTLKSRLIVSHILPVLLIVPIVGVALVYILETQLLLTGLSNQMLQQGVLTADVASDQPRIWSDATEAQRFVALLRVRSDPQIVLLDRSGHVLASSEPGNAEQAGQLVDLAHLANALAGEQQVQVAYVPNMHTQVVQVLVPVIGPNQQVMGVVHLSQRVSDLQAQFGKLRSLIAGVLAGSLVLGVCLGLALALNLGRSLQRVTNAVSGIANGSRWETLPVTGPEEVRTLLRAFNSLIGRLRAHEESRRQLLANLVHELGRPLGALQSGAQALLNGADQDPELRQELLQGMDTQIRSLRPLLDNLADLHGQVLGTLELNRQPTAVGEWLPQVVSPWRQVALDKGLEWHMAVPDSLPVVEIDPDRMGQVVGNLLSNAIKYTTEGSVSITANVYGDELAIAVADTGIGIDPSEQARIFEPFYRGRHDKRFPQGMGLGLSIARDLVLAHGGRLEVQSRPGRGSNFTIWLPSKAQHTP